MTGPEDSPPPGWAPADGAPSSGSAVPPPPYYPPPGSPNPPPQVPYYPPPGQQAPFPAGPGPYGPGVPAAAMGYGMSPYGTPPPRRSRLKWVLLAAGVIIALIGAIVVAFAVLNRDTITRIDDVSVGSCITVTGEKNDATPKKASCDEQSFNFIVAQKTDSAFSVCGDPLDAQLTQDDRGKLCLVPNLRTGKCYVFPTANGSIVDFAEIDCAAAAPEAGNLAVKVVDRVESASVNVCTAGTPLQFTRPKPLTYCATLLTPR
ncbi:LppU/SCO3897 family protein [Williamsia sp. M5A3_1d]